MDIENLVQRLGAVRSRTKHRIVQNKPWDEKSLHCFSNIVHYTDYVDRNQISEIRDPGSRPFHVAHLEDICNCYGQHPCTELPTALKRSHRCIGYVF